MRAKILKALGTAFGWILGTAWLALLVVLPIGIIALILEWLGQVIK